MNDLIMMLARYLLFFLIVTVLFALAHLPILFSRYDIKERYLHCRPIAAIAILMLVSGNRFSIPSIIKACTKILSSSPLTPFFNTMMPQRNFELVFMMLMILLMNLGFLLICDLVVVILYLIFRGKSYINLQGADFFQKIIHFPWNLTSAMYMDSLNAIEHEVNQVGCVCYYWVKSMKAAFPVIGFLEIIGLSVGIVGWSSDFTALANDISWGWYMLPTAGYLLFEQLQFFLEHVSDPSVNTFQSDEIGMDLRGHLRELVNVYEQYFSGSHALINEYVPDQISALSSSMKYNGVTNAQQDACSRPHVLTILSNQLKEAGARTSQDYNNILVALLNDFSVSVRDYLQGEILLYLCAYMNYFLAEGETFLVLCMDSDRAEVVRESISGGMNHLNKVCGVWRVGGVEEADNNESLNVLVCGFQELVSHKLLSKRKDFFRSLKTVIIDQAVTFSTYSNIHKEMVFSELGRISKDHQYVLVSEVESPTLEASFGSYISREIYPFKNVGTRNDAYIMVWAEEGAYRIQSCLGIGGDLSEYMGVSMTLALAAVKWQFPSIHVHAGDTKPLATYRKAMNANMREIRLFIGRNTDYTQWIKVNDFSGILDKDNLDMIVLYDDHFNLYSTLWSWMKYGGKQETLIHIVSPSYMLRDYFACNIKSLVHRDNDYAPLIGWRSGLNRSRFQALLLQMSNAGILESELMEKRREYGWSFRSVGELLEAAMNSVLRGRRKTYNIYESFSFSEDLVFNMDEDRYETQTTIRLIDETIRKELITQTSFVRLRQNTTDKTEEIPILQENLTNYYLRDQKVSIKGILRNIVNIEDGVLYTENVASDTRKTYYQASEFIIGSRKKIDQCVDLDILDFNIYVAYNVKRIIKGYWSSDRGINLADTTCMQFNRIYDRHERIETDLVIEKNNLQVLEIRIPKRIMGGKSEEMTLLLAFMLGEVTKTLFPESYMNLYVVTEYDAPDDYWKKLFSDTAGTPAELKIHSIIPFIRANREEATQMGDIDPGEWTFTSIYIMEFSSVELGMITSLYTNRTRVFRILLNYLEWYMDIYMKGIATAPKATAQSASAQTRNASARNASARETGGNRSSDTAAGSAQGSASAVSAGTGSSASAMNSLDGSASAVSAGTDSSDTAAVSAYNVSSAGSESSGSDQTSAASVNAEKDKMPKTRYFSNPGFLHLGFREAPSFFAIAELRNFCEQILPKLDPERDPKVITVHSQAICSFCGRPTVYWNDLHDGRRMCSECESQVISQQEEIQELYETVVKNMYLHYGVKVPERLHLRFASAEAIRNRIGTGDSLNRVLGFCERKDRGKKKALWIESRGPRNTVQSTLIHELTHYWQIEEFGLAALESLPPDKGFTLMEGHASYVEVRAMREFGETDYADAMEAELLARDDVYGIGYRAMADFIREAEGSGSHVNPFEAFRIIVHNTRTQGGKKH